MAARPTAGRGLSFFSFLGRRWPGGGGYIRILEERELWVLGRNLLLLSRLPFDLKGLKMLSQYINLYAQDDTSAVLKGVWATREPK